MRFTIPGQWVIITSYAVYANNPSEDIINVFISFTKLPNGILTFSPAAVTIDYPKLIIGI